MEYQEIILRHVPPTATHVHNIAVASASTTSGFFVGRPRADDHSFPMEQLVSMRLVGLYRVTGINQTRLEYMQYIYRDGCWYFPE